MIDYSPLLGYSVSRQVEWERVISKILAGEFQEEFGVEMKQETTLSPVFDSKGRVTGWWAGVDNTHCPEKAWFLS